MTWQLHYSNPWSRSAATGGVTLHLYCMCNWKDRCVETAAHTTFSPNIRWASGFHLRKGNKKLEKVFHSSNIKKYIQSAKEPTVAISWLIIILCSIAHDNLLVRMHMSVCHVCVEGGRASVHACVIFFFCMCEIFICTYCLDLMLLHKCGLCIICCSRF